MRFVSLQFLNLRQSVGLLGRVISPSQGRYLTQTQIKRRQTSMPWVGFGPTIPVFEQAKTVHALYRAATVVGTYPSSIYEKDVLCFYIPISMPVLKNCCKMSEQIIRDYVCYVSSTHLVRLSMDYENTIFFRLLTFLFLSPQRALKDKPTLFILI
jgi:hypothetical protein